jgi:hypothetical protein
LRPGRRRPIELRHARYRWCVCGLATRASDRLGAPAGIVTLDADLSHDPADIPRLLGAIDAGADVAIGSRFMIGGRLDYVGWQRDRALR